MMIYENSNLKENECDEDSFDSDYEDEMFDYYPPISYSVYCLFFLIRFLFFDWINII